MTVIVPNPFGLFESNSREKNWFFTVYNKLTEDLKTKTFTDFTPTLSGSGSMTISSPTISVARQAAIGELVFIEVAATFTVGGTPDLSVQFELPLTASGALMMPSVVVDGGNELSGFALLESGDATVSVRRDDGSNWNAGASREIRVSGVYRSTQAY